MPMRRPSTRQTRNGPRGRDQDGGNPAEDDPEIRDHRQGDDDQADERREVQTGRWEKSEQTADQKAVHQTDEQLAAEVGDDVAVDLGKGGRDFVFEWRIAQRQVFAPATLDRRAFLEEEERVNRHHHEAEEEAGHTEETTDACLHQRPEFRD